MDLLDLNVTLNLMSVKAVRVQGSYQKLHTGLVFDVLHTFVQKQGMNPFALGDLKALQPSTANAVFY